MPKEQSAKIYADLSKDQKEITIIISSDRPLTKEEILNCLKILAENAESIALRDQFQRKAKGYAN